jgi:hypothetical protein
MWSRLAQINKRQSKEGIIAFDNFRHGLNTRVPASQIAETECSELVNFQINSDGQLQTRAPIIPYTTTATTNNSPCTGFKRVPIGGTFYELLIDANNILYYLNSGVPTTIGTLNGEAQIIPYNGVIILTDGSFIKYIEDVTAIKIAYDDGTGSSGYQHDNKSGTDDNDIDLGNGTNTRVAAKIISQTWETGYTIPPTTVTAKLKREANGFTGTDNVDILVKIRKISDDSVIASKTFIEAPIATNVSATATEYSATFSVSDITTEMSLNTEYYLSLEYANGDATNYVGVRCSDIASGGIGYHYTGSWAADSTLNPIVSLRPGMPPKASFGEIKNLRLFLAGDPDNPGYVWFCNLTHLDWSTSDGGGHIGAVDEDKNNYNVGAIVNLYSDLFVFGTKDQPYLCKLSGTSPANYALPLTFQRVWSTQKTALSIINDIFFMSNDGAKILSGVQEYGDLRTHPISDVIENTIIDNWDSDTAFCEYYPTNGQVFLCLPIYHKVLICHIKNPVISPDEKSVRYPWSEYEFYLHELTSLTYKWTLKSGETDIYYCEIASGGTPGFNVKPDAIIISNIKMVNKTTVAALKDHQWFYGDDDTLGYDTVYFKDASGDPDTTGVTLKTILIPSGFSFSDTAFYILGNDGLLYTMDDSEYKDQTDIQIDPKFSTKNIELPFGISNLNDFQLNVKSIGGANLDIVLYVNGSNVDGIDLLTYEIGIDDSLTIDEAIMELEDALFPISGSIDPLYKRINVNANAFKVEFKDIILAGHPLYVNGLFVKYKQTGLR